MNKYWKYILFPRFLDDVKDCVFINMDDLDLQETLNGIVISALQDFKFSKVALTYEEDTNYDPLDSFSYGYFFTDENIGEAEYKVILSWMKYHWISTQITWANNFQNPFFDKDIKGYSPANMLKSMESMMMAYLAEAKRVSYDYNRINKDGKVAWGCINNAK